MKWGIIATRVMSDHAETRNQYVPTIVGFVGSDSHHQDLLEAWERITGFASYKADVRSAIEAAKAFKPNPTEDSSVLSLLTLITADDGIENVVLVVRSILEMVEIPNLLRTLLGSILESVEFLRIAADELVAGARESLVSQILENARQVQGLPGEIDSAVARITYPEGNMKLRDEVTPILKALDSGETTDPTTTVAAMLVLAAHTAERDFSNPLNIQFRWYETLREITSPQDEDGKAASDAPWLVILDLKGGTEEQDRINAALEAVDCINLGVSLVITRVEPSADGQKTDEWKPFILSMVNRDTTIFGGTDSNLLWEKVILHILSR